MNFDLTEQMQFTENIKSCSDVCVGKQEEKMAILNKIYANGKDELEFFKEVEKRPLEDIAVEYLTKDNPANDGGVMVE